MSKPAHTNDRQAATLRAETVMRTYLTDVVGKLNLSLIPEFTAPDMVDHTQPSLRGPEALAAHVRTFTGNIPDLEVEVVQVFAGDDFAIGIWRWTGTPNQPIWGRSASGKPVTPTLIASIFQFKDGMLTDYRPYVDAMEMINQLN